MQLKLFVISKIIQINNGRPFIRKKQLYFYKFKIVQLQTWILYSTAHHKKQMLKCADDGKK